MSPEFVKLTDLHYSACKGCVWLCAGPQVCRLEDDLFPYYQKVKEASAVILGSPIHFGTVNATMLAFISRLWGYRHVNVAIKNKPFILVLCGMGETGDPQRDTSEQDFRRALRPFRVNVLDVVKYSSRIPPCYRCGRHQGSGYPRPSFNTDFLISSNLVSIAFFSSSTTSL